MGVASATQLQGLLDAVAIHTLGGLTYQDPETREPAQLTTATATRFVRVVTPALLNAGIVLSPSLFAISARPRPITGEMILSPETTPHQLLAFSSQGRCLYILSLPESADKKPNVIIQVSDAVRPQGHSYRAQAVEFGLSKDETGVEKITGRRLFVFQNNELDDLLTRNGVSFADSRAVLALMTSAILGQLPQGTEAADVKIQSAKIYSILPPIAGSSVPPEPMTGRELYIKKDINLPDLDWAKATQVDRGFVAVVTFAFGGRTLMARVRKYHASEFPRREKDFLSLSLTYSGFEDITPGIQGPELTGMDDLLQDAYEAFSPI